MNGHQLNLQITRRASSHCLRLSLLDSILDLPNCLLKIIVPIRVWNHLPNGKVRRLVGQWTQVPSYIRSCDIGLLSMFSVYEGAFFDVWEVS